MSFPKLFYLKSWENGRTKWFLKSLDSLERLESLESLEVKKFRKFI